MQSGVDRVSLASGAALLVLGVLLLLEQEGTLDLGFNLLTALVAAALGTILLISGLSDD
ncbi:MAG TPA: hypothetical protein VK326_04095 [Solirubrobacterales bacterium]|nr:hypothetical protein [Solirubrobacterales bacterium]